MIDFTKLSSSKSETISVDPIEIYKNLDRSADTSELRSAQDYILSSWFKNRYNDRDVVVKMHTGDGKTLVGLLMLYSKMNNNQGPSLYVCPNKQLVRQVKKEAERFGIPFIDIEDNDGVLPNDFIEGRTILGVTVQKLFNGKSKFGLDNEYVSVGTVVLDDAHACIGSIRKAFTISLPRETDLYKKLLSLFWDDLAGQGEGTLHDVVENNLSSTVISVPFWSWIDKSSDVTKLLSVLSSCGDGELGDAIFAWPLLRDSMRDCQMFVSSKGIEIAPYLPRVSRFSSFAKASQRIIMSATTQDDSFFVKGLDFSEVSLKTPLQLSSLKWSGEKMVIIPSLIDSSLNRSTIIDAFFESKGESYGVVAIVPSLYYVRDYEREGVCVSNSQNISGIIERLKNKDYSNKLVLVNRYDGIDLPDSSCRILIIDSIPTSALLVDRYEDACRRESDIVRARNAQKIEQGLGRGVRGEKDYCAILVVGADLVRFIMGSHTNKYFSPQTRKQVDIGVTISKLQGKNKGNNALNDLYSLLDQLLSRDSAWKKYYQDQMTNNELVPFKHNFYHIFMREKEAEGYHLRGDDTKATRCIQDLINECQFVDDERGWYLQQMARYYYYFDKMQALKIQNSAFHMNMSLFRPPMDLEFQKLLPVNAMQVSGINKYIQSYSGGTELQMEIEAHLSKLSFGVASNDFELALYNLGKFLGWSCEMPDRKWRQGPDVLFCSSGPKYVAFECKNEVLLDRDSISKKESGQMNNHIGWFARQYGEGTPVDFFIIIPTNKLAEDADFNGDVRVITQDVLSSFKNNVRDFVGALVRYDIQSINDTTISSFIHSYNLSINCFRSHYSKGFRR